MFFGKKKNAHDTGCYVCHIVVMLALFAAALASLLEVVMAHYVMLKGAREATVLFGTNAGALSLIAFAVTTTLWMKSMKACVGKCEVCSPTAKK